MKADPRSFVERVEDALLIVAGQLAHVRHTTLRRGLEDFRATCIRDYADCEGFADWQEIWALRQRRTEAFLAEPSDDVLRKRLVLAREREREFA